MGQPNARPIPDLSRQFERAADFHPHYFPVEIGIDPEKYSDRRSAGYAGVKFYGEQGAIHGVHARVEPEENGAVRVAIEHWVHRPNGDNIITPFLTLEAAPARNARQAVMRVKRIDLQGQALDLNDRAAVQAAVSTCQQVMEVLRLERRMPLLNKIAATSGLKTKPLPDTYKDGNARLAYEEGRKTIRRSLRIPAQYVPAVTGFFEQGYAARENVPVLFHAVARGGGNQAPKISLHAEMKRLPVAGASNVQLRLTQKPGTPGQDLNEENLIGLAFRRPRSGQRDGMVELASVTLGDRAQALTDHRNLVRVLHFAHDVMLDVRHGMVPDLADIISYTNTQRALSGPPPLCREEGARFTTRVLGGNPTSDLLSDKERGIGANCFADHYEYYDDKGRLVTESLVRDCGIMALDRDKTGYDGKMAFAGDYFPHRDNPKHKPRYDAKALYITHWHYDHDGGVPHLLLAGYRVDHLICNAATKMHIEDICKKLDVPREWMPKKWTVIDPLIDRAETLQISRHISAEFGWTPHSAPTSWIHVKTPQGSLMHFSDAKIDPNVKSHPGFDVERLKNLKPTIVTVDSTRVSYEGPVRYESDVENEMIDFINTSPDKAPVTVHIGTNSARMTTTADAYGRTNRHMIIFGASMRFTKKVLDKVGRREGAGLKEHAAQNFGTKILDYTANAVGANKIIDGDLKYQGLLITGTHNEPMSIVNRLIEDKDQKNLGFITPQKYKFIVSQTGIPGSESGYNKMIDFLERRGFEYKVIHTSGHGGRYDIEAMLGWVGARYGIATHGDAHQRLKSVDMMRSRGMIPIDPSEQDVISISNEKGCDIIGQDKSMMTFFTIKRPKDRHYGGGEDVEYLTEIVAPDIRNATGDMIRQIAQNRAHNGDETRRLHLHRAAREEKDAALAIDSADLRPKKRRVQMSLPDYMISNGFLRRVVYDTETTQLGKFAWITQFAARQEDVLNPEKSDSADLRQILPPTILPDLQALLITGVLPSSLYAPFTKGEARYPTRYFYHQIKSFLKQSKTLEDGTRIWIDGAKTPNDPSRRTGVNRARGDAAYLERTIDFARTAEERDAMTTPRAVTVKTSVAGFNNMRSDNVWMQHLAYRAGDITYSPMNSGGVRSDDLRNMARMFAYLRPDKFKVRAKPENPAFLDFTVQGVMEANNLGYQKKGRAHEGMNDVDMEREIDKFMRDIDPELYTRMMMNANPREVKKYLAGTHNGMVYPRHLLTYVNGAAAGARANIGVYVGRSTDERYTNKAVLFNVSDFDPKDFIGMGPQEIAEIMGDRNHPMNKAFEIININRQPLIASVDRGMAVGANRGTSMVQMKNYKHFIERHPEIAANMVKAMEIARTVPDHDHRLPMEERIYAPEFMRMSSHDRALAKLFVPVDEEFTNILFANRLNRDRAAALDQFHSRQLRERYVGVMCQIEREVEMIFGKTPRYLHPDDRDRMKAREKARVHGRFDNDSVSLGRLQKQIADARQNWAEMMKDKKPAERALAQKILNECEALANDIDAKIRAGDPDWAMTPRDLQMLGLDDNINYGDYRAPLAKNPYRPRKPKPPTPEAA